MWLINSCGKWGGGSLYFIFRNIWIRFFFCFGKKDSIFFLLVFEKIVFSVVGFGEKSIVFYKCGNVIYVYEKIIEVFLVFVGVGGYEILWIVDDKLKNLMEILMFVSGYLVSYLKGIFG